jgi:hypothetical protein
VRPNIQELPTLRAQQDTASRGGAAGESRRRMYSLRASVVRPLEHGDAVVQQRAALAGTHLRRTFGLLVRRWTQRLASAGAGQVQN